MQTRMRSNARDGWMEYISFRNALTTALLLSRQSILRSCRPERSLKTESM